MQHLQSMRRWPMYIAHPLGNGEDRDRNRENASQWVAWLTERYSIAPVADWIILSGQWSEDRRELGLEVDHALVRHCKVCILVGGEMSAGMRNEASMAERVVDLTFLGRTIREEWRRSTTQYGNEELADADRLMAEAVRWLDQRTRPRTV